MKLHAYVQCMRFGIVAISHVRSENVSSVALRSSTSSSRLQITDRGDDRTANVIPTVISPRNFEVALLL